MPATDFQGSIPLDGESPFIQSVATGRISSYAYDLPVDNKPNVSLSLESIALSLYYVGLPAGPASVASMQVIAAISVGGFPQWVGDQRVTPIKTASVAVANWVLRENFPQPITVPSGSTVRLSLSMSNDDISVAWTACSFGIGRHIPSLATYTIERKPSAITYKGQALHPRPVLRPRWRPGWGRR